MDNMPMPCDIALRLRGSGEMFGITDKVGIQYNRETEKFEQYRIEANDQGGWGAVNTNESSFVSAQKRPRPKLNSKGQARLGKDEVNDLTSEARAQIGAFFAQKTNCRELIGEMVLNAARGLKYIRLVATG